MFEQWQATHRHAEGGLYRWLRMVKVQEAGAWHEAVLYDNAEGLVFVRKLQVFNRRFTEIPAARVKAEHAEAESWIKVSDRMPPHGENVLFLTKETYRWYGWRDQAIGQWLDHFDDGVICFDADVTSWRPYPAVPH